MFKSWLRTLAVLGASLVIGTAAQAQTGEKFPSHPITILVGFAAGGGGDMSARWVADYLRKRWNVPVIVDNKPGAGGTIAAGLAARAKPDGYTVVLATASPFTVAPYLQKLTYDPGTDFTYLFQFLVSAQPLFVRADSPFKTIQDLMDWTKSHPKQLFWSTAATNGGPHIATQAAFKSAGLQATYVPYKGGADAVKALLGGEIQALVAAEFPPYAAAGQVRLLAESGPDKIPGYPDVPTYKELGFPVSLPIFYGFAAPAGIPPEAVHAWDKAAEDMMRTPEFAKLVSTMKCTPSHLDHAGFQASVVGVYKQMAHLVPELALKN
jgi:tripartite-type tricarboxylate transporter receptor subunit TctC